MENATENSVRPTLAAAMAQIEALVARVEALEAKPEAPKPDVKEMTDADAERVLTGDLAPAKHKEAAAALGLTYGQIYSCRKEFTFKAVHKAMKDAGIKNPWA